MTVVAIHQPNYAPWLGYFHKMAEADLFIFLDDAQFSKGSYINRVQIAQDGRARWLTVPVQHSFGAAINVMRPAREDWAQAHLDTLKTVYGKAACFRQVWSDVAALYAELPAVSLAAANMTLVGRIAERLGIATKVRVASAFNVEDATGDDRLIALCARVGGDVAYLSGRGGANYQDEAKFAKAGVPLRYTTFMHPTYDRGAEAFVAGLSVLDSVFHLGWQGAAALVRR